MKNMNIKTKKNQKGFVMTSELILLSTTLVVGLVIGLSTMRDAVTAEMEDVAEAIGSLDQSYAFDGMRTTDGYAEISGSGFIDEVDTYAGDEATFEFVGTDFSETSESIGSNTSVDTSTL